jgi:hypothetical protein
MIVLTATSLLFFFLLGLLAVNGAIAVASRTSAQRAADAGALAGCLDLPGTFPGQDPVGVARQYVESPQRNNTGGAASLHLEGRNQAVPAPQVSTTGATGANGGVLENNKITVWVQRSQRMFGITNVTVRAKAACTRQEGGAPVLHSLSTSRESFRVDRSQLNLPRGGIVVGRTDCAGGDPKTMSVDGGATITARWIDLCTGGQPFLSQSSWINPPATHGWRCDEYGEDQPPLCRRVEPPPLNGNEPAPEGCDRNATATNPQGCRIVSGTAYPGVYYGGLELGDGQPDRTVRLRPGIYYMAGRPRDGGGSGGGFVVRRNTRVEVEGPGGVLVYNGSNPFVAGSLGRLGPCASIVIEDSSVYMVPPPADGPYSGLSFFQARDCTAPMYVRAGVTMGGQDPPWGVIYLPAATIFIGPQQQGQGGQLAVINMRVIAYEIDLTGPVHFGDIWIPSGDVNHGDVKLSE